MPPHVLDNVRAWDAFRKLLDLFFGIYRNVAARMRKFGIDRTVTLLDIGCGTGQHSRLTDGEYLGLDFNPRYIAQAQKKFGSPTKRFVCQRLQDFDFAGRTFDVTLLVAVLHHIADADAQSLLAAVAKITRRYVVIFDPTTQSRGNYLGQWLTRLDRGKYIRTPEREVALIAEHCTVARVFRCQTFFTEGVAIFAKPR